MSSGDAPRPRRRRPERRHVFVGQVLHPPKEHLHDCVTVAGGEEDVHAILQVCRQREHLGVGDRPSLVEDELVDVRGDRRCAEGHEPIHADCTPGACGYRVNNGRDIFELSLERIVRRVGARPSTPPVDPARGTAATDAIGCGRPASRARGRGADHCRSARTRSRYRRATAHASSTSPCPMSSASPRRLLQSVSQVR